MSKNMSSRDRSAARELFLEDVIVSILDPFERARQVYKRLHPEDDNFNEFEDIRVELMRIDEVVRMESSVRNNKTTKVVKYLTVGAVVVVWFICGAVTTVARINSK